MTAPNPPRRWKTTIAQWVPGLLVALAAGVATAHGLYEVALAAGTPELIAWLYPLITDGLALVAYAATSKLTDGGRAYAWSVVVLAAGLSGLAQAVFLAGGVGTPDPATAAPDAGHPPVHSAVAFGVGAWPAIAAAIVAHLLFMLGHAQTKRAAEPDAPAATVPASNAPTSSRPETAAPQRTAPPVQPPVQPSARTAVQPARSVQPTALPPAAPPPNPTPANAAAEQRPRVQPVPSEASSSPTKDRARAAAREHLRRTGQLPTVTVLMNLADVARGTAGTALKELREQPADLHVVTHDEHLRNSS